jgi:EmrB/QacA subfamily drug resistance transporter
MQTLDATILTTALPRMASSFGVAPADLSIGITSYMLALAAILPISGWLAERLGPRNVFAAAIVVFTVASVLCALSSNLWWFTAARILQGVGGSLLAPVGRAVALRNTSKKELMGAVALMVWPALAAPIIGPALGGFIVTYATWPWIFLVNVPVGLLGLILSLRFIPDERTDQRSPFDVKGFATVSGAMIGLVGGLEALAHSGPHPVAILLLTAGVVLGVLSARRFAVHPFPLIPLDALAAQTFKAATLWGGTAFRLSTYGATFLLPLMFQVGFGMSPITSGLLMLAYFAGNLAIKPFTIGILRRFGFRHVLVVNGVLASLAIAVCALFSRTWPLGAMSAALVLGGATRSMHFTCLDSMTYAEVSPDRRIGATTLSGVSAQVGAVVGVAAGALLIKGFQTLRGGVVNDQSDFQLAFLALGLASLSALPVFLRLTRDAGAEVSGHKPEDAPTSPRGS